jgi:hypothetical protein
MAMRVERVPNYYFITNVTILLFEYVNKSSLTVRTEKVG